MAKFNLNTEKMQNGVYILSEIDDQFESDYIKLREKEKRIYSDEEVSKLPFASISNPHKYEWNMRANSFLRFKKYLNTKKEKQNILDLGCGNGWFSGNLLKDFNHSFYCVDVNITELKQGARVFESEEVKFIYADIFSADLPKEYFDFIILNASVQYFPDIKKLLPQLFKLVMLNGEIHIVDSPFYSEIETTNAKKRTKDYYSKLNFPEMAEYYHHHSFSTLKDFKVKVLYNPSSFKNKMKKLALFNESPFHWIVIRK
ncbi:MAG: class I SAM-dependent methyltransferase [Ignavibacteria bacterium]|nr:class I SAM-dependent methyltransferase [Ignavibacteria bacterium]MBT8381680.1 class I SAM-dependent methyltransferase [Ignavibacteria bacterium]MBT8392972.1 class I SAM-dependent methyltransferase [Ignavibacteria bacterium]NNJ52716.1 class I SAM-dependent methyltransferase [Ignavibacteriaceae bacterium]NNL20441.1 class I SAM-dependent methyltransferase [Ignavibacteriaceae bacterium]